MSSHMSHHGKSCPSHNQVKGKSLECFGHFMERHVELISKLWSSQGHNNTQGLRWFQGAYRHLDQT